MWADRAGRWIVAGGLAALVALLVAAGCGAGGGDRGDEAGGRPLPDAELTSLDADRVDGTGGGSGVLRLADVGDGPLVVNLWATWCGPCRDEMPAFDAVARAAGDDVRIVGVNIGDGAAAARRFVDDVAVGFPQYLDEDGALYADLGVTGMPTTVFVDGGEVVGTHTGALTADGLAAELRDRFGVTVDPAPARPAGTAGAGGTTPGT